MRQSIFEFIKVEKIYTGGTPGLYAFDLHIDGHDGIFAILGGEFEGKSTFCRVLAGLETLSGGEMRLDGVRFDSISLKKRSVAMSVPIRMKMKNLTTLKTVFKTLAYPLKLRHEDGDFIDYKVVEVAKRFGLYEVLNTKVGKLSQEHLAVLSVARPFVRESKILVFDNPFFGLSEDVRSRLFKLWLREARMRSGIVVYVTDSLDECVAIGGRCAVISDCTVMQSGTLAEITAHPNSINVLKAVIPCAELLTIVADETVPVHKTYFGKSIITCKSVPDCFYDANNGFLISNNKK